MADNRDLYIFVCGIRTEKAEKFPTRNLAFYFIFGIGHPIAVILPDSYIKIVYTSGKCHAFDGRAVAIVRTRDKCEVKLSVYSEGLKEGSAFVSAK